MPKLSVEQTLLRAKSHEERGEVDQARALYKAVLQDFPNDPRAQQALAALESPETAASEEANPPQDQLAALVALYNQGQVVAVAEKVQSLLRAFPSSVVLWNILGATSLQIGQPVQAAEAFRRALELNPNAPEIHYNMGNALFEQGKLDEAIAAYARALAINPDLIEAHNNWGNALRDQGKLDEAIAAYVSALGVKHDDSDTNYRARIWRSAQQLLYQMRQVCDWSAPPQLDDACKRFGITKNAVGPTMLAIEDDPAGQMKRAEAWARENYKQSPLPLPPKPSSRSERLRIGYFSADFHDHATLYLMAGLFRDHDRKKFELFAYSYGRIETGDWRRRAERDVEHFIDVKDLSDGAIVELARSHALDIAVDLKGYTQYNRSRLFQFRLAPLQINYLGYPASMGAGFIDYLIADRIVIPEELRRFYTERIVYLPHSYLPNDDAREIAKTNTKRADFGLPEDAFVFCCFNNNYKIGPREFDIWMRLLTQVEGSVLWLFKSNKWAEENLRREAQARGADPSRLVFADRLPHAEHLARHKHADLFIDTFNCNAHTTASDALWAGLPVVTKQGQQFAARAAASLLNAVGLPELIVTTEEAYETLILDLATNRDRPQTITEKLEANRLNHPLFDTRRYTRAIESGLRQAYDRYLDGKPPADIWAEDQAE